ncbi:MAG: hypothetical protein M3R24_37985 [Chloroflexota bacterium]|nr:hypothetical protein [Chloroflexota bacterium]
MKNRLFSLFGRRGGNTANHQNLPWLHGQSIYAHILHHLDPATGRLSESGVTLPDEERRYATTQLRWVPGAMDGAFGRHFRASNNPDLARTIAGHIIQIAHVDSEPDKIALYTLLLEDNLLDFIDPALEQIVEAKIAPYPHLHAFARFLAREAPDRGPVKCAITLLGLIGDPQDKEMISVLGRHEEFTLYTAVALANMLPDPEPELWQLAQTVDGWGRIHLVERLATTNSSLIKDWLLRQGYRNSVMYEYLAYTCATSGNLAQALSTDEVDHELLDAAGDILAALIHGGPAEDINDYADAAGVIAHYLRHVEGRAPTLERFTVVDAMLGYLTSDDWDAAERSRNGWTGQLRAMLIERAQRFVGDPQWPALVQHGLYSTDQGQFHLADRAADRLGIDTWEIHWQRLQERPAESYRWYRVMQRANADNIGQIVQLATKALPLEQVATGPADELGLGPEYQIHQCIEAVVQELGHFPSVGWSLIAAALQSPVVRQRNMALRALAAWGKDRWSPDIERALAEAHAVEPRPDVKERIDAVRRGAAIE